MPHLFIQRRRQYSAQNWQWERVNAYAYVIGGIIFVAGSVLFLPKYSNLEKVGSYLFIVGSIFYLVVSCHDLSEVLKVHDGGTLPFSGDREQKLDFWAATLYTVGTIFYIVGSFLFLPDVDEFIAGAWSFIVGSVLFLVGAVINSVQIFEAKSARAAFMSNLTAVSFVIGSVLFLTASVPYLWTEQSDADEETLYRYIGIQYIVGSLFFTIGGMINYQRAWEMHAFYINSEQEATPDVHPLLETV